MLLDQSYSVPLLSFDLTISPPYYPNSCETIVDNYGDSPVLSPLSNKIRYPQRRQMTKEKAARRRLLTSCLTIADQPALNTGPDFRR